MAQLTGKNTHISELSKRLSEFAEEADELRLTIAEQRDKIDTQQVWIDRMTGSLEQHFRLFFDIHGDVQPK